MIIPGLLALSQSISACSRGNASLPAADSISDRDLQTSVEILAKHTIDNSLAGAFGVHAVDLSERHGFDGPRTVQAADLDNDSDLDVVSAAL